MRGAHGVVGNVRSERLSCGPGNFHRRTRALSSPRPNKSLNGDEGPAILSRIRQVWRSALRPLA
jgi:hypothetical protein